MSTRNGSKAERQNAHRQTSSHGIVQYTHLTARQLPGRRYPAHAKNQQKTPHHLSQNLHQKHIKAIAAVDHRCNRKIVFEALLGELDYGPLSSVEGRWRRR